MNKTVTLPLTLDVARRGGGGVGLLAQIICASDDVTILMCFLGRTRLSAHHFSRGCKLLFQGIPRMFYRGYTPCSPIFLSTIN